MRTKLKGFTLIELIVFIVVLGIAVSAILSIFRVALTNSPTSIYKTTAAELAQARMEIILGQRRIKGFSSFSDPCPSAAVCAVSSSLSAYSVSSSVASTTISGDSNYKIITVTVTGPKSTSVVLKTLVASY